MTWGDAEVRSVICWQVRYQGRCKVPKYTYTYDKPLSLQIVASNRAEADERFKLLNEKLLKLIYEEKGLIFDKGQHIRVDETL
jgi:hypothetical protein